MYFFYFFKLFNEAQDKFNTEKKIHFKKGGLLKLRKSIEMSSFQNQYFR